MMFLQLQINQPTSAAFMHTTMGVRHPAVWQSSQALSQALSCPVHAGVQLFPVAGARSNMCMVVVDPLRRIAKVLYHAHVPYW
jgi:hypothetical protein